MSYEFPPPIFFSVKGRDFIILTGSVFYTIRDGLTSNGMSCQASLSLSKIAFILVIIDSIAFGRFVGWDGAYGLRGGLRQ